MYSVGRGYCPSTNVVPPKFPVTELVSDFLEPYEGDEDRTPPYITFTTPSDDAVGVDTSASLSITFNETISRGEGEVTITEHN